MVTSDSAVALCSAIRSNLPQRLEAEDIIPAAAVAPLQCHAVATADRYAQQLRLVGGGIVRVRVEQVRPALSRAGIPPPQLSLRDDQLLGAVCREIAQHQRRAGF